MFTIPPRKFATLVTRLEYIFYNNLHIPIFTVRVKYKSLKTIHFVEISIFRHIIRSKMYVTQTSNSIRGRTLWRELSIFIVGVILLTIKVMKMIGAY